MRTNDRLVIVGGLGDQQTAEAAPRTDDAGRALLTPWEVAQRIGCTRRAIDRWIATGRIESVTLPDGRVRIPVALPRCSVTVHEATASVRITGAAPSVALRAIVPRYGLEPWAFATEYTISAARVAELVRGLGALGIPVTVERAR